MKQIVTLLLSIFILNVVNGQINVRVKNSPSSKEIDIKTGGKQNNTGKQQETKTTGATKTTSATESVKPAADTLKPAGSSSYDESYNGKAKVQLKAFWRYMEKLRAGDKSASALSNAIRMLDQVKEIDPGYDVSALEAELKPYIDRDEKETLANNATKSKKEEDEKFVSQTWNTLVNIYSKDDHLPTGANNGEEFLKRAQSLDLAKFYSIRDAAGANANGGIKMVDAALKDYNAYLDRCKLINWVYGYINESKTGSPEERMAKLNQAKMLCEGVLIIVPDRADFSQKLNDLAKLTGNVNADVAKFITSEFHKEHLNKIVFSTKPLVIGKEKEMAAFIKKDFKPGEMLFGTVYLGRNVKEAQDGKPILRINFEVEHGRSVRGQETYLIVPDAAQNKPYFQFAIVPDEQWVKDNYNNYLDDNNWTIILMNEALADDNSDPVQKVKVELKFWKSGAETIAADLSYDISDGAATLKNIAKKLRFAHLASVKLPKAGISNPSLEQQMLAVANNLGWKEKYTRTIITSSDWYVTKNQLTGAILHRGLSAVCITKDDEGRCYYQEFSFTQDYAGGGFSSKLKFGGYGGKKELTCDKVK